MFDGDQRELDELMASSSRAARAVARSSDESFAEDLAQETLLAAISSAKQPRSPAQLRTIARNLATSRWRHDSARSRREETYAAERSEAMTEVAPPLAVSILPQLIARLDARSRALVRRHYFDGRSLKAIAVEDGTPIDAVRTRHRRALERLRSELEHVLESDAAPKRRARAALAMPLTWRRAASAVLALRPRWAAAALTATAAVGALFSNEDPSDGGVVPLDVQVATLVASERGSPRLESVRRGGRTSDGPVDDREAEGATSAPSPSFHRLEVVVIDEAGSVVPGASVLRLDDPRFEERALSGATDRHGSLQVPDDGSWLFAQHPRFGASMARRSDAGTQERLYLRLRPSPIVVRGRAVTTGGAPVAGAVAELGAGSSPRILRDAEGGWRRTRPRPRCVTDANGCFELRASPKQVRRGLAITGDGLFARVVPEASGELGDVVLAHLPEPSPTRLRLEDRSGRPVTDVVVHVRRDPMKSEPPTAVLRGWSALQSSHAVDASGVVELPAGLPDHARVLVCEGGPLRRVLTSATAAELGDALVVEPDDRRATGRVQGWLDVGTTAFLMSDGLALPLEVEADEAGGFVIDGVPAGPLTLLGRRTDGARIAAIERVLEPGGWLRDLAFDAATPNALEFEIDSDAPLSRAVSVRLFRPNGKVTELRAAEQASDELQFLDRNGRGRFLLHRPGRYFLRSVVEDRVTFDAFDVTTIDGRLETKVLRPVRADWLDVSLEGLASSVPTRTTLLDEEGNVVWTRVPQLDAGRFRAPATEGGLTVVTRDAQGVERIYSASATQVADAGRAPLVLSERLAAR